MSEASEVKQAIETQKVLPLYYHHDSTTSLRILEALYAAGIRVVEYTSRGENAFANFKNLLVHSKASMPGLLLGIGTIRRSDDAKKYMDAGAAFIVSPIVQEEIAKATQGKILWIPGCMTPTEISLADSLGAKLIKLFPGNILGPGYINAIRELFPYTCFMPTGGVEPEEENLREWFSAGAVAVGMGSRLISKKLVEKGDFDSIKAATADLMQLANKIKTH